MQTSVLPYSHGPVEMCSLCQSTLKKKEHRKLHTEHVLPIMLEFSATLQSSATETIDLSNLRSVSLSTVCEKY